MHYYTLDAAGELIFTGANHAAELILGLDHTPLAGQPILAAFPELAGTEVPQRYREVAQGAGTWYTEQFTYSSALIQGCFAVWAFQTAPNRMVASFLDITSLKQYEVQIEGLNHELTASNVKLSATNAELSVLNEELLSTNEELSSTLEELNASNEELTATNEELRVTYDMLEGSKQYAETVIEAASVMIVGLDRNGRITLVNLATELATGYSRTELLGRNWFELVAPRAELPAVLEMHERWQRGETDMPADYTNEIVAKSGARRTISWRNVVLQQDGAPSGTLSYGIDVTERLAAEQALRESEERLRLALQAGKQGIYDLNVQTGATQVSPEYATMLGYDPRGFEETNAKWIERLHPDDRAVTAEAYRNYIAGETPVYSVEFRQRTQAGDWRWILSMGEILAWDEAGAPLRMLGTHTDIHQRKEAEIALRESEARYRLLFEAESDAIVVINVADLTHLDVNQAAVDLYGYTREELLNLRSTDLSAEPEQTAHRIQSASGIEHVALRRHRKKDGAVFPVEITARAFEMEGRQVLLVAIRDVTQRVEAQREMVERERKLQSIFRAAPVGIGMTVDRVLREVNASMCAMTGYTAEEMLGQNARFLYPSAEEFDSVGTEKYRRIKERGTGTVETQWVCQDGSLIDILLSSSPIDPDDLSQGVTFTALDITQRKLAVTELREAYALLSEINTQLEDEITERLRAHEALAQTEERFRLVVQSSYDVIALLDREGNFTYTSPAIERVLGYGQTELLGQNTLDFVHEADRAAIAQELFSIADNANTGLPSAFRYRHADGHWVHLEAVGRNLLDHPGIDAMLIAARDISERIAASTALRNSEQFLRAVLDSAPLGISVRSNTGRLLSHNAAWQRIWAMTDEEVAADMLSERQILNFDERDGYIESWWEEVAKVYREGGVYFIPEVRTKSTRSSAVQWISQCFYAIPDSSGAVESVVVITQDITDRKLAEETLRESEEKFRSMTERLTDVLFTTAVDGTITYLSPSAATIFGWTPEEMAGHNFTEYLEPGDTALAAAAFRAAVESQSATENLSLNILCKDGRRILGELNGVPIIKHGRPVGTTGLIRDVTQRERTQQELRESKEELDRFFTIALDLLCIADTDGNFRRLNQSWVTTLGYEIGELVGHSFLDLIHPDDLPATLKAVERLSQGQQVIDFTNRYRCKDGSYRWIEWRSVPYEDKAVYAAARDITDKLEAEEEHQRMEEQLRQVQKMEALGTLAGGIAHDFNNILFAIMGNAELLLEDLADHPQAIEKLTQLLTASNRARDLVQQILAFSRQTHREPKPVHMGRLAQEVVKLLRATLPAMLDIRLTVEPLEHAVMADPSELHQVVMNLASNAAQAIGDQPGVLEIALRQRELTEPEMQLYPQLSPGTYLELSVRDSGHGIPPEVLDRIFEPFFTTKELGQGTGMGLAVVHGIVTRLGGIVFASSTAGEETTMTVLLPVIPFTQEHETRGSRELPHGSASILLVEDDASIRRVIVRMLGSLGYQVLACASGREALEHFSQAPHRFDLVLTDQSMPGMAGIDLARELLALRPGLPVVMATGYSQSVTPDVARQAGISEMLYKPVRQQDLAEALQRALKPVSES